MKSKVFFFLYFLIYFQITVFNIYSAGQEERTLTVLYTSSLNGNLDGCTCKSSPKAGLVKRAVFLRNILARENIILLDSGDIFDTYPDKLLAENILDVYEELGYDAIGAGDQEFSNGFEKLLEYRDNFPIISNNLIICPDEYRCIIFSDAPLIINKEDFRIGVFSILDPQVFSFYSDDFNQNIIVLDIRTASENMVSILEENNVDITVLLYHGYYDNAKELVNNVSGIDVVIVGHEQSLIDAEIVGESIIVSPGEEGNRVGILEISVLEDGTKSFNNSFELFEYSKSPDDPYVREIIDNYNNILKSRILENSR